MIIKVKKRDLLILSGALILIILIPYIYSADDVVARKAGFGVWVVISNQNPTNLTINNVTTQNFDPVTGSTLGIVISFNVSDPDGLGNVNGSDGSARVVVNFTLGTPDIAQFRTQTSCVNSTFYDNRDVVMFNCTVNMKYYDNSSDAWVINVTVYDSNGGSATNGSERFTYNALSGFLITARGVNEGSGLNFSGVTSGGNDQLAKAPLLLNNTGNDDFDQINITGANLLEQGGGSGSIAITSFYVNVTNNTNGFGLQLSTAPQTIPATTNIGGSGGDRPNATLMHGPAISGDSVPYPGVANSKTKGNQTLIFFVDVPAGTAAATYNNTWNMTVVDID